MAEIYLALVDTPGIFAGIIRQVIKIDYIHVTLSMDKNLETAYSVGRRNPSIPFLAGFTREQADEIERAFPDARYKIIAISCTSEQKENILKELTDYYEKRHQIHYCILGLPFILLNRPFYQKNHYTCSSFLAKLLSNNGVTQFSKHFSLVTPKDFYIVYTENIVFEGKLCNYIQERNFCTGESVVYELS